MEILPYQDKNCPARAEAENSVFGRHNLIQVVHEGEEHILSIIGDLEIP